MNNPFGRRAGDAEAPAWVGNIVSPLLVLALAALVTAFVASKEDKGAHDLDIATVRHEQSARTDSLRYLIDRQRVTDSLQTDLLQEIRDAVRR